MDKLGSPSLLILGTRGIPAQHGGFETFAERLALFLAARGWHVAVYCQREVARVGHRLSEEIWRDITLLNVEVACGGPRATLEFDAYCVADAARRGGLCLVLGYNAAVFLPWLRLHGCKIITNMDGIEWRRPKWSRAVRGWFWLNEWIAAWSSHRLVADHPRIADHLATRRSRRAIATIGYGGDHVSKGSIEPLCRFGLRSDKFLVAIARVEPDNNTLTLVEAFSRKRRSFTLVVLGQLDPTNPYHCRVRAAASQEVLFLGAIYDQSIVQTLRAHARAYLHGHTVGGTNPSLVESLWAGSAVVAHDNAFNRYTAGDGQFYFSGVDDCDWLIDIVLRDDDAVASARQEALAQARRLFNWQDVLGAYEQEFLTLQGLGTVNVPLISPM